MSGLPSGLDLYRIQIKNRTEVTMFILMGFTDDSEMQIFLFLLFLAIYLFTMIGNLGLVFLVVMDSRLHNPMYYFLTALSFLDACYSSVITPQMLINFLSENKTIFPSWMCHTDVSLSYLWDYRVLHLGRNGL